MSDPSVAQVRINEAALRLFAEKGVMRVTVSELAQAAGVARGTIYNNCATSENLFEEIAHRLADDLHERIGKSSNTAGDPARALANGIRLFVKQAHDEPQWGRFILRFAFTNTALQGLWRGQPARDLNDGISAGRYRIAPGATTTMLALMAGAGLSAMFLVLEGHKTWHEAGSEAAEFVLRALGIRPEEARTIAGAELLQLAQ